jgi:hypothetical protein
MTRWRRNAHYTASDLLEIEDYDGVSRYKGKILSVHDGFMILGICFLVFSFEYVMD